MPRRSRSGKHKRTGGKSSKNPPKVYFGKDSHYQAVRDIGKKGVDTPKELLEIAAAQLADLADLKTIDNDTGKLVKWVHSPRELKKHKEGVPWSGRVYVLWRLFYHLKSMGKLKGKKEKEVAKKIKMISTAGHKIMEIRSKEQRIKRIKQVLKKAGFKDSEIKELLEKTN